MKRILLALCLCAMLPAVAGAADAPFVKLGESWAGLYNARNADELKAMYADDATLMPPNSPTVRGKEEIGEFLMGMFEVVEKVETQTVDTAAGGDVGYRVGTYRILDGEGELLDEGKFVEVWKRVKGKWLMQHDIWNSDYAGED